jgi:hypothetical protein
MYSVTRKASFLIKGIYADADDESPLIVSVKEA